MTWTVPNMMTVARLCFLPLIVFLLWPGIESRSTCFIAGLLYVVAGAMDIIDGAVARSTNQVTVFGKFFDPLADKLFYLVTLVALLQLPGARVPAWMVMLVIVRELAITGLRAIAVTEGVVIAAGEGGKLKTTFATVGMVGLIFHYSYILDFGFTSAWVNTYRIGLWITGISLVFSFTSAYGYIRGFVQGLPASKGVA
jgi:CDP-diacylglycerol--glycerol-3-phosphate 3-phosphatidyltransferase